MYAYCDEMDSFQQPAFSFIAPNEDFNPEHVPVDGEQYLQQMFHERSKCPSIVVASIRNDLNIIKPSNEMWKLEDDLAYGTPESLLPTREWMQMQSNIFQKLRDEITSFRLSIKYDYEACDLPEQINSTSWLIYCQRKQPLLRSLLHINQRELESIVEIKSGWLTTDVEWYLENAEWYPKWVFCSLACLRLPLEGRVLSSLRDIAKTAIRLRKQLSPEQADSATPLNLIISIVTRNFNQYDLDSR